MKKAAMMMALLLLVTGFAGCTGEEAREPAEPAEPEVYPYDAAPASELSIIQFETIQVSIRLPDDWEIVRAAGSPLPGAERTYNFTLTPPDGESVGIITIGNTMRGPLTSEEFSAWYSTHTERILPQAVEETAEYTRLLLNNGFGVFSIFTDADLVGTTPPPDEYLYLGMFFGNWENGFLARATLLTNDKDGFDFNLMLLALSLMEVSFSPLEDSFTLENWDEIRAAPVYDIAGFSLLGLDLAGSGLLTEYILESTQSAERFSVPVIIGGEPYRPYRHGPDEVIWSAGGIGMMYYLLPGADIYDILDSQVGRDIQRLQSYGFFLSADFPLRASAGAQAVVFGMNMKLRGEPNATYIYLLQNIPDSEYTLMLLLIFFPNHWSEEAPVVLAELSERIGIDLIAYWPW